MLYKVINTALLLNGKLIPEGSAIELSEEETVCIKAYLQPLEEVSNTNNKKKTNIKKEKIK